MSGAWVALAGVATQAYGAYNSNKNAKKGQAQDKKLIDAQKARQGYLDQFGVPLLKQGGDNLGLVQQYLQKVGSGDRAANMEANAPEINRMTEQQHGAVAAQRSLYPRNGATASQNANLPFQLQGNINNLMFDSRRQAMGQLGQLGQNQASLGLSAMGQGAGLTNSMLQYGLDARQQNFNQGAAVGNGMMNSLMMAYMMRPQGGASPATNYSGPGISGQQSPYAGQGLYGIGNNSVSGSLGGGQTSSTQSYNPYQTAGK